MTEPLPLCVLGGGLIGQRHAQVAQESDLVRLTAVVEPDPRQRDALAALGYPTAAGIDAAPAETRAAIIATPTGAHLETACAALDRGWAALVEKPIAATLEEADTLCDRAEAAGLPLVTGHHRRCHPFVAEARARLGEIGDMVAAQGVWCVRKHDSYYEADWRRRRGAGPIMTNLSHEIDLLRLLAGEIVAAAALVSNAIRGFEVEDTAAIALRFESGALGTFLISEAGVSPWSFELASGENPMLPKTGQDYLSFIGAKAALGFPSCELWQVDAAGEAEWRKPLARAAGPVFAPIDPLREQVERFARLVGGAAQVDLASGRDGRATLAATLAVQQAAATGRPCAPSALTTSERSV